MAMGSSSVDRITGERHPVLPADQTAHAAGRGIGDVEIVTATECVDQPFMIGRHELPVSREQPGWPDGQDGVEEAGGPPRLAFIDPDDGGDPRGGTRLDELVHERPGDLHRLLPHPGVELRQDVLGIRERIAEQRLAGEQ
jgi:hypothetical protein